MGLNNPIFILEERNAASQNLLNRFSWIDKSWKENCTLQWLLRFLSRPNQFEHNVYGIPHGRQKQTGLEKKLEKMKNVKYLSSVLIFH